jgi:hypothetical protein
MSKRGDVLSVTEPITMGVVGDRLHITLISGSRAQTYAVKFNDADDAAFRIARLLEESAREHRVYQLNQQADSEG